MKSSRSTISESLIVHGNAKQPGLIQGSPYEICGGQSRMGQALRALRSYISKGLVQYVDTIRRNTIGLIPLLQLKSKTCP
jgi:hypothetical protein